MNALDGDEASLVGRLVRHRDPAAFHVLYVRHTPMLFALAVRLTLDPSDAEDAVHDTWLRAVSGLRNFRGDSALRTWLTGVLINRVRETRRARTHEALDDLPDVAQHEPALTQVDPIDLERAFAEMPVGYREIVLLHDVEGFTHEEIARLLGVEPGTSKSQLSRGRRWLRRALRDPRGE